VNGLLAQFGSAAPFVAAAQELAADAGLRERLRTQAAETARALTWDRVVDDLEAVLRELVDQARASRVATTSGGPQPGVEAGTDHAPL
jgi:glycosyltransferase involved in cell wall biosynthesis